MNNSCWATSGICLEKKCTALRWHTKQTDMARKIFRLKLCIYSMKDHFPFFLRPLMSKEHNTNEIKNAAQLTLFGQQIYSPVPNNRIKENIFLCWTTHCNEVIELYLDKHLLGLLEYLPIGQSKSSFLSSVRTRDLAFKLFSSFCILCTPRKCTCLGGHIAQVCRKLKESCIYNMHFILML